MRTSRIKARQQQSIRVVTEDTTGCRVTKVRIGPSVEAAVRDGYLCFWTGGREVCVGPLTAEQAEKLCEDLGYEAVC